MAPRSFSTAKTAIRVRTLGFSLVEIVLVVGILFLLAAMTAAVYARMKASARVQATTTAMGFLYNANLRYQQVVPLPLQDTDCARYFVDFNNNGVKDGTDRAMTSMEYFLLKTSDNPDCQAQLNFVPKDMLAPEQTATVGIRMLSPTNTAATNTLVKTGYVLVTIKDPWGTEFKYRSLSNATRINVDATVGEQDPAIPYSDYAFFASAGPDAQWGTLTAHDANQPGLHAGDNIYSFTAHQ